MAKHANSIQDIVNFALEDIDDGDLASADIVNVKALADEIAGEMQSGMVGSCATSLDPSVEIKATDPVLIGFDDKTQKALYKFEIQVDGELSRPSFSDKASFMKDFGEGGVVTLLNNGYTVKRTAAASKLSGTWHGIEFTPEGPYVKMNRAGAHFIEGAIRAHQSEIVDYEVNMDIGLDFGKEK